MDIENEQTKRLNENNMKNLNENIDDVFTENFANNDLNKIDEVPMTSDYQDKNDEENAKNDLGNSKKSLGKMVKRFRSISVISQEVIKKNQKNFTKK
ncbi:MAG: serine protease Do [Thermoanaerobacterium sp.]|nr:serine protease Do [Thermoanaerobacterium sp.]MDK2804993.1 serine protease Do [Thermoanaerobacterium sp.]